MAIKKKKNIKLINFLINKINNKYPMANNQMITKCHILMLLIIHLNLSKRKNRKECIRSNLVFLYRH